MTIIGIFFFIKTTILKKHLFIFKFENFHLISQKNEFTGKFGKEGVCQRV